ncbi:MAG: TetR/AcrR family transcriptional regulator [Terracidiphilus sp.]|nr:TetR/AcrR family transcriptional regulator [Terracidiphilus sp.]
MKVSKEVSAQHKEQIIAAAARHYRERGFEGVSVAELMKDVGLTHGGFYRHFSSKEELIAAASLRAVSESINKWRKIAENARKDRLQAIVEAYLSLRHHDHPETGCLLAALGGDLSRHSASVKDAVTEGERQIIDFLSGIAPGSTKALRRRQAIIALASMVGGMILARVTSEVGLRGEILRGVAHSIQNSVHAVA